MMLMDHFILEFLSQSEIAQLLRRAGCTTSQIGVGTNYVSYINDVFSAFITPKPGTVKGEWNEDNCTDHIMVHFYINGTSLLQYEMSLQHMRMTTKEIVAHLTDLFSQLNALSRGASIQSLVGNSWLYQKRSNVDALVIMS